MALPPGQGLRDRTALHPAGGFITFWPERLCIRCPDPGWGARKGASFLVTGSLTKVTGTKDRSAQNFHEDERWHQAQKTQPTRHCPPLRGASLGWGTSVFLHTAKNTAWENFPPINSLRNLGLQAILRMEMTVWGR